jgi:hypothetical protein
MDTAFWKHALKWGFILWLMGYVLGFVFFAFVPIELLGWAILPIGIIITLWVLYQKITATEWREYFILGLVWVIVAIVLDYFFIVQLLQPADGYYKLDVYVYYALTLFLPVLVGMHKTKT